MARRIVRIPETHIKKYDVIYIDPPWSYRDKALAGKRGACCKYSVMSKDDLKNLNIQKIASDNCCLFIWITMPKLDEVFDIIKQWEFEYKTNAFTWVKKNKKADTWFWGMGRWTRANAELCLLATKGKPKRESAAVHSIIDERIMGHSKKPDIVRDKIVELFGDIPKVEIFAREAAEGWDVLGNEIDGKDIKDVLNG